MKIDLINHHRRSIRIKGYDYAAPGGYYVTIVSQGRVCLFGNVADRQMQLSPMGMIADECWRAIPEHFPNVEMDVYVVMPNHMHGIIILHENAEPDAFRAANNAPPSENRSAMLSPTVGAHHGAPLHYDAPIHYDEPVHHNAHVHHDATPHVQPGSLGSIIRQYKSSVTRKIIQQFGGVPNIWQRNYYEHIIRDDEDHNRIRLYIESNPVRWVDDNENPERQR